VQGGEDVAHPGTEIHADEEVRPKNIDQRKQGHAYPVVDDRCSDRGVHCGITQPQ
jgi:hypothetical protein